MQTSYVIFSVIATVGLILIAVGTVGLLWALPHMVKQTVKDELYLRENSDAFDRWVKFPVPIQWKMWFFNITNPGGFDFQSVESLHFEEVGPFVYDEIRWKEDVEFLKNGTAVSYIEKQSMEFNANLSYPHSKDEMVNIINLLWALPKDMLHFLNNTDPDVLSPVITDTMDNIAFSGIKSIGQSLFGSPSDLPATINTGKNDIDKIGIYETYNFQTEQLVWKTGGECNWLNGTDGTFFHPFVEQDDQLWVFETMVCRRLQFRSHFNNISMSDIDVKGIPTKRFVLTYENFAATEQNECFCLEDSFAKCPAGLLNIRKCTTAQDAEIIVSAPYFYTNPSLLRTANLQMNKPFSLEEYATILDIEPTTGTVLNAHKRLQLNVKVKKNSLPNLNNLKDDYVIVPLMWLEEGGEVDWKNANKMKNEMLKPIKMAKSLLYTAIGAGVLAIVVAALLAIFIRSGKPTERY